jgi:hypothetical protein
VRSTNFGRGRLEALYSTGPPCPPFVASYTINKRFTTSTPIVGPDCVEQNVAYTWSVNPLISTPSQIAAQIGIDNYEWAVEPVTPGGIVPTIPSQTAGNPLNSYSGDFSAIRLVMPPGVGAFRIKVKVGACNTFATGQTSLVNVSPPIPVFTPAQLCRASTNNTPFVLSISTVVGATYTWGIPPGWSISPATATLGIIADSTRQRVTITPNAASGGTVTVVARAGQNCTEKTAKFELKRELNPAQSITNVPPCLTQGVTYQLGISNTASNSVYTWSIPAGYTGNGVAGPASVQTAIPALAVVATGQTQGTLSVSSDGCTSGSLTALLRVNGTNGCTYSLTNLECATIRVNATAGTNCLPATGTTYVWQNAGNPTQTTTTRTVTFPNSVSGNVTVTITNPAICLRAVVTQPITSPLCAGRSTGTPKDGNASGGVKTFPNPTGSKLNLDLPLTAGQQARLIVSDATGRQQLKTTTREARSALDLSSLPNGIYTLRAELPTGKVVTQKVVVRH